MYQVFFKYFKFPPPPPRFFSFMSKNHTIRGCKGLEKNEKQGTFFTQTTQLLHLFVIQLERTLGTKLLRDRSFFTRWGGGGWWDLGGSPPKNGFKGGGAIPKKTEGSGGHAKYFSSCRVDMMFYY